MMLRQVTEHVWYLPKEDQNHRPALGYVCCGRESMMVDAGNSPDHVSMLYGNVRARSMPDPEYAVLTHWHWDHVFGLSGSPAKTLASHETNEHLLDLNQLDWSDQALTQRVSVGEEIAEYAEIIQREILSRHTFKVRLADMTFSDHCSLRLDEIMCHFVRVGGPHSEDAVVVHIPEDKVLFVGDCYLPDRYHDGCLNIQLFEQLITRLRSFKAETIITSHENDIPERVFFEEMEKRVHIGKALSGITETDEGAERLKQFLKREPTEEEAELGKSFVLGNREAFVRDGITHLVEPIE